MKSITIAGRIGKDAETRTTQGGDQVTGFTVAVDEGFGDKKRTLWFDVSFWGKRGASLAQYLTKGTRVCVTGDLGTREYNGKTYMTVRADQITLLGGGNRDHSQEQGGAYSKRPAAEGNVDNGGLYNDMDDEVPF